MLVQHAYCRALMPDVLFQYYHIPRVYIIDSMGLQLWEIQFVTFPADEYVQLI